MPVDALATKKLAICIPNIDSTALYVAHVFFTCLTYKFMHFYNLLIWNKEERFAQILLPNW